MSKKLTIIIFTHNEEKNIKDCLTSAKKLTNNIIVIDSESTDKTIEIIKKENIPFFTFPYQYYVEPARNFGIKKATSDWILILDADERITDQLAEEIKNKINHYQKNIGGYKIARKNIFLDKWLKYGGWWPDYQIRLINKNYFLNWPEEIHSTPVIKGKIEFLSTPLIHLQHQGFDQMVNKTIIFEDLEANLLYEGKKRGNTLTFFRKFLGELFRRLIKKAGFLDGTIGIIEAIYQSFSKTITYLFLYEKYQKNRPL
ncbi:MAG: glycosyltransferase family 2 protein [Patescibacteria group bacterium]|nr:glycosyltransferase family 2 protein [Patescibacteria group bacterium]